MVIHESGLSESVQVEFIDPRDRQTELRLSNPLGKVPTIVMADGQGLFDSAVICDWIVQTFPGAKHLVNEEQRWPILRLEALADGLLDAGLLIRQEGMRPEGEQSADWIERQTLTVRDALARLEELCDWQDEPFNLGHIAVMCTLDWLDFRHPHLEWAKECPRLAGWYNANIDRPSMLATARLED